MIRSSEEILADIDATLEQLIQNADACKQISINPLFTTEVQALQKTQESLLARLMHMQELLKSEKCQKQDGFAGIEKKVLRFGKLNTQMINHFAQGMKKIERSTQPRIGRNRKKKSSE